MSDYLKPGTTLSVREKRLFIKLVKFFDPSFYGPADGCLMEQFVCCFFSAEDSRKLIRKEGELIVGQKNNMVVNPRTRILDNNIKLMNQLAVKLRLSAQQRNHPDNVERSMRKAKGKVFDAEAVCAHANTSTDDDELDGFPSLAAKYWWHHAPGYEPGMTYEQWWKVSKKKH